MSEQELNKILLQATAQQAESEIIEFKEAKENYDFDKIGKYFSALSNEANLKGKHCAWLIFGIEDKKHRIVGSNYRKERHKLDSLKREIADKTTQNISFIEIYELQKPEGRVIMFQIPAAPKGIPIAYDGFYFGRANESLVALDIEKIERILNQAINYDWSKNIVPDADFDDLDKEAILKAREQYKKKHSHLANDIDIWDDITFLNKAKVTLDGEITNTAILLLGKDEASSLISPAIAQITWVLKDAPGGYEHYHTPFILTVDKVLACIRNTKYSYMVDNTTLFPQEVSHYDEWVMRETLHNAIAHQDYSKQCRIIVLEYSNRLIFENAGGFIPNSVEEVIHLDRPQAYYRNPFLVEAMVNLNMIDTIGSGIKKMFITQRNRFFPLPTYNISNETKTEVTIHGEIINDNYSYILFAHPELSLDDVIALDKAQKKITINEMETARLRELKLILGTNSNIFITDGYPNSFNDYKNLILKFIKIKGTATREDINNLIIPLFPENESLDKKQKRVSNMISKLAYTDKKIENISQSIKYPVWKLCYNADSSNKNYDL
jgi:ATP-dependent DNA helicase RecG